MRALEQPGPTRLEHDRRMRRGALMPETRRHFQEELGHVLEQTLAMGEAARELFGQSLRVLSDPSLSNTVIAGDDEVDVYCTAIEKQVVELFALETPVACDLRLLTALL